MVQYRYGSQLTRAELLNLGSAGAALRRGCRWAACGLREHRRPVAEAEVLVGNVVDVFGATPLPPGRSGAALRAGSDRLPLPPPLA